MRGSVAFARIKFFVRWWMLLAILLFFFYLGSDLLPLIKQNPQANFFDVLRTLWNTFALINAMLAGVLGAFLAFLGVIANWKKLKPKTEIHLA